MIFQLHLKRLAERHQMIRFSCLTLLLLVQICILPYAHSQNANNAGKEEAETCVAPNGSPGHCLVYTECANLALWRRQHNLQNSEDVKKMLCSNDEIHVCCNHTNPYLTDTDYLTQLNPDGLALLQAVRCTLPLTDRVANGKNTILGQYPFMALLRYDVPGRPFLCGGSLITSWFVLTAGHCITPTLIGVRLGEYKLSTEIDCVSGTLCLPEAENFLIAQKFKHPNYNKPMWTHDVALLKLDREVKFKIHIKPICLPISPLVFDYKNLPKYYYVAGWGHTQNTNSSDILQHAKIPHQDRNICERIFAPHGIGITYDHICAGGKDRVDTCKGDSGGPLFAPAPFKKMNGITFNRQVQFGIVSFGFIGCGDNNTKEAAYANVFEYMPWITNILALET
ncbi:serine protease grass-like [Anastrepha obliqua]|uniref:serine protease grass-like n=1 Tax=Anastrepha obliqua TaxID=95512 RepID=UPI002409ACDF|nr:serine protease grass-like [Anastrepha obliqua]